MGRFILSEEKYALFSVSFSFFCIRFIAMIDLRPAIDNRRMEISLETVLICDYYVQTDLFINIFLHSKGQILS